MSETHATKPGTALFPIALFLVLLIYGLFLHPVIFKAGRLPLEVLILLALTINSVFLMIKGYKWEVIQNGISGKIAESVPVLLILFSVGVLIGSWIVSGTIPMLIYYGISVIDGEWVYLFAFLICIVFSLLTGTSWGSAGTIGIVMMGIAEVYEANLMITAGAIVGGSFFGDKMSPLSDTTNIASLAADVPLFDHIRSMMYTTGPAALIAGFIYFILSPGFQSPEHSDIVIPQVQITMDAISETFNFNLILLLPLLVVIGGAVMRKPIVLTLLFSAWLAMILAFLFQEFSFTNVFNSFNKGFSMDMAGASTDTEVLDILNRGGLYNLIEGITITILIFAFIGTLEVINAIETLLESMMKGLRRRRSTVVAALSATAFTNLSTSNQYATSFIIGAAFRSHFDKLKIPRKVLSRSIEDAGTMLENLAPWTPSGIFMATTLGVATVEYAPYQFLSIINLAIAYLFAFTGWACFYNSNKNGKTKIQRGDPAQS